MNSNTRQQQHLLSGFSPKDVEVFTAKERLAEAPWASPGTAWEIAKLAATIDPQAALSDDAEQKRLALGAAIGLYLDALKFWREITGWSDPEDLLGPYDYAEALKTVMKQTPEWEPSFLLQVNPRHRGPNPVMKILEDWRYPKLPKDPKTVLAHIKDLLAMRGVDSGTWLKEHEAGDQGYSVPWSLMRALLASRKEASKTRAEKSAATRKRKTERKTTRKPNLGKA